MSREYEIKDILAEAAGRDRAELPDAPWIPSQKHREFEKKLLSKQKNGKSFFKSGVFKSVSVAAAIVLLFGICMAIKPVREPVAALFGSMFRGSDATDAPVTAPDDTANEITKPAGTEGVTTKPADTEKPETKPSVTAAKETEPEETNDPFKTPETDEEWIDYAVSTMARKGYTREHWRLLDERKELAVEYLYKKYFNESSGLSKGEKAVISVFVLENVRDELESARISSLKRYIVSDKEDFDRNDDTATLLGSFISAAKKHAKTASYASFCEKLPATKKLLDLEGMTENDYYYDYSTENLLKSIKKLAVNYDMEKFTAVCCSSRADLDCIYGCDIDECLKEYFETDDEKVKTLISWLFYEKARYEIYKFDKDGTVSSQAFKYTADTSPRYKILDFCGILSTMIENYREAAVKAIAEDNIFEDIIKEDHPYTYRLLVISGFTDFRHQSEFEYACRDLINEIKSFYRAVKYGDTSEKGAAEIYDTDGDLKKASPALIARVREFYPEGQYNDPSFQPFHSQKHGMETVDDWYDYYSKYLPGDVVKSFLSCENRYFFIADNKIYTTYNMSTRLMNIDVRGIRAVEEKDGYTVISFSVENDYMINGEYTLHVVNDGGALRAVGGTFIDYLMSFPVYGSIHEFFRNAMISLVPCGTYANEAQINYYGVENEDLPAGFAGKLTEYFGSPERHYNYFSWESVKSLDFFKNRTREFFSDDFVEEFYTNNPRFIEADGTVYAESIGAEAFSIKKINSFRKVSGTRFEFDLTVIYTACAPGQPTWNCTMTVEVISGKPIITGGTFLTKVLMPQYFGDHLFENADER